MTMTMRGTPYFMAPEVFEERYGYGSDIWSVGCVAIQMSTGLPPWKDLGINNPVLLYKHIKKAIEPPLDLAKLALDEDEAARFSCLLNKCFMKNPQQRPSATMLLGETYFRYIRGQYPDEPSGTPTSLFSPGLMSASGLENVLSPATKDLAGTPGRYGRHRRSNSIGGFKSPFMSPPIPRQCEIKTLQNSYFASPQRNTSDWPSWARSGKKMKSVTRQIINSPSVEACTTTMGSLAISDDSSGSAMLQGRNLFLKNTNEHTRNDDGFSGCSEGSSTLNGEKILESV